jgi:thiosulfate/3-mercaptopyruvate sulfurtransferase
VYTNIISATDLAAVLPQCTVLDCRAKLGDPNWGRRAYLSGHIAGAYYADLDRDLADPPNAHGRHPLPERARFEAIIRRWGVDAGTQVVTYDDAGGAYAARAWWMFRWMGHESVAVLDGGLAAWGEALKTGDEAPPGTSDFSTRDPLTRYISSDELSAQLESQQPPTLVDARTRPRWAGAEEPIDPIAGHIPGAHCYPFKENLNAQGGFKSPAELRARFNAPGSEIVCYCGSGVTAAHNILAMHIAGLAEPLLYADSWSGWITDPSRPVATAT